MKKTHRSQALLALAAAALLVSAIPALADEPAEGGGEVDHSTLTPPDERGDVANFDLENLAGDNVSLSDFEGSIVVVNFWATWCVPCLQELPFLQEYYAEYADQGLVVLAITTDGPETLAQVRNVARRGRWTMPVLLDQDGSVAAMLNPRNATPLTMMIDRQGRLAAEHEGYTPGVETNYLTQIQALLAE